jgi:hypothetical protein
MKFDDLLKINNRVEQGAWVDAVQLPGVKLKVRGELNSDYERLQAELWSRVPAEERENPEVAEVIDKELLAKTVLIDWKGLEDSPFTPENVERALAVRVFRQAVVFAARTVARRGSDMIEGDAKNS